MKKIFMIITLFLATVASYGNESSNDEIFINEQTIEMYDFSNFNILESKYELYFSKEEKEKVSEIMKDFNEKMKESFYSKNRKKKVMKVLQKNTQSMCDILSIPKYRLYLRILNVELNRRGIDLF